MEQHCSVVHVCLSEAGDRCVWIVHSRHHASATVPQHVVRQAIRDSVRVRSVQQLSSQLLPRPLRDKQYLLPYLTFYGLELSIYLVIFIFKPLGKVLQAFKKSGKNHLNKENTR